MAHGTMHIYIYIIVGGRPIGPPGSANDKSNLLPVYYIINPHPVYVLIIICVYVRVNDFGVCVYL